MLRVDGLHAGYGALRVLHGVSLSVRPGEAVAILGANGAGKTTLLRAITGSVRPTAGEVVFQGRDITHEPDHVSARLGIGHVLSGRELFPEMTVADNLEMGAYRIPRDRSAQLRATVLDLFPALEELSGRKAGVLSGGQQQMVATGRALMTDPSLLLLDEPSTGLAPSVVAGLFDALRRLIERGTMSVVLVEQNAEVALRVVQRAYVLRHGRIVLDGTVDELRSTALVDAYLGT